VSTAEEPQLPPLAPHESARERLRCWGAALSCWLTAACFLVAWWWPRELDDGRWVKLGVGIMVAEFIVIHSTAMMTAVGRGGASRRLTFGLLGFYALFAIGITAAFRSWIIAGVFALLLGSRGIAIFRPPSEREIATSMRRSVAGALLFIGLAFATVFVPFPRGGVDRALLGQVWPDRGSGVWERHPERALAMGLIYFAVLGWVERRPVTGRWVSQDSREREHGSSDT
jgi:hypothetical protein